MPLYEVTFIIKYNYISQEYDPQDLLNYLVNFDNKRKVVCHGHEYWGLLSFAYPIKKKKKGHYVMVYLEIDVETLKILQNKLPLKEDIVRFMFLKIDKIPDGKSEILLKREKELAQNS